MFSKNTASIKFLSLNNKQTNICSIEHLGKELAELKRLR